MANFNPNDYETVEERLRRFWGDPANADARIVTLNHTQPSDRAVSTWVVEARIYMTAGDQSLDLPKATGWAFEIDGVGMANKTSALENAETSAIGRALGNMNYSGNKRASREEMQKVARGVTPVGQVKATPRMNPMRNFLEESQALTDIDALRLLWAEAKAAGTPSAILDEIKAQSERLSGDSGLDGGAKGSTPKSPSAKSAK